MQEKKVNYTLKTSEKMRVLRVAVSYDGAVTVTAPRWVSDGRVEAFIASKAQWINAKLDYFKQFTGGVFIKNGKREYHKYKDAARRLCERRVRELNEAYGFTYGRISIKNHKSRWGSCSKKGNLNFNYKLVHLPPHLADYVITHELCHLQEFNHSKKFWALVARTIPNHRALRHELKTNRLNLG